MLLQQELPLAMKIMNEKNALNPANEEVQAATAAVAASAVGQKQLRCEECEAVFDKEDVLRRHAKYHRLRPPRFIKKEPDFQDVAEFSINYPNLLIDAKDKFIKTEALGNLVSPPSLSLYQCEICNKVFFYRSGLTRHKRVHDKKLKSTDTSNDKNSSLASNEKIEDVHFTRSNSAAHSQGLIEEDFPTSQKNNEFDCPK